MSRPRWEVAHVFRQHGSAFREAHGEVMSRGQHRVMAAIEACRTAVLGGHVRTCDQCDFLNISYNSCRNRHCPKCQSLARARWLQERQAELLPVEYFHVVFTVPEGLNLLSLRNPALVYRLLFQCSAETLLEVAANPLHLGAQLGVLSVLHTWGQNLLLHPHIHCIIPNGGLAQDTRRWVSPKRSGFFLPVRILSTVFRAKLLHGLYRAWETGQLELSGPGLRDLAERGSFLAFLRSLKRTPWVVYAKRPFGGPQQVLDYLGRYTHRVAISNERVLGVTDQHVVFRWKDYRRRGSQSVMTVAASDFIRRFLSHVLPSRFVRIRYYGFLANRHRRSNLVRCRAGLPTAPAPRLEPDASPSGGIPWKQLLHQLTGVDLDRCPKCSQGRVIASPNLQPSELPGWLTACQRDTS